MNPQKASNSLEKSSDKKDLLKKRTNNKVNYKNNKKIKMENQ